jgi:hypothetical protein
MAIIMSALPASTTGSFFRWPMFLALLLVMGSGAVLWWFGTSGFYWSNFAAPGPAVSVYLLLRVLFAVALAWVVYSVGVAVVLLLCGRLALLSISGAERYGACFLVGAGVLHVALLGLGFAGWMVYPVALILFASVLILSLSHLAQCIEQAAAGPRLSNAQRIAVIVFLAVAATFVLVKSLYPGGGHDYYNHYFPYYRAVVEGKGLFFQRALVSLLLFQRGWAAFFRNAADRSAGAIFGDNDFCVLRIDDHLRGSAPLYGTAAAPLCGSDFVRADADLYAGHRPHPPARGMGRSRKVA